MMDLAGLNALWELAGDVRTGVDAISVHSTGTTSNGSDVCVGLDGRGCRHLLIPLRSDWPGELNFKSAGLGIRRRDLQREAVAAAYLDLLCLSPALNEVFSHLVLDVLSRFEADEPAAAEKCLGTLEDWKELFGPGGSGIGGEQVVGLVGELLLLERLTSANPGALSHWDGPLAGIHDFRSGRRALEVKASTRRHGRFFTISGHRQLEPPDEGDLHLAAVRLERNPGGAIAVAGLLERVRRNGVDPVRLAKLLAAAGYEPGKSVEADTARFDLSEMLVYEVGADFPKLVSASFAGGLVPSGVLKIAYEIDLSGSVPAPLSEDGAASFLRAFATGGGP